MRLMRSWLGVKPPLLGVLVLCTALTGACVEGPRDTPGPSAAAPLTPAPPELATPSASTELLATPPTPSASLADPNRAPLAEDPAGLERWIEQWNRAETEVATALRRTEKAWNGRSWPTRERAAAMWHETVISARIDPESGTCWGDLATMADVAMDLQGGLAERLSTKAADHMEGRPWMSLPIPGWIEPEAQLRALVRSYDFGLAGKTSATDIVRLCYPAGHELASQAPSLADAPGAITLGSAVLGDTRIPFLVDNDSTQDSLITVQLTFLDSRGARIPGEEVTTRLATRANSVMVGWAWTFEAPPSKARSVRLELISSEPTRVAPVGAVTGVQLLHMAGLTVVAASLTNTVAEGWCGQVEVGVLSDGQLTSSGFDELKCPALGETTRVLIGVPTVKGGDKVVAQVAPGTAPVP